MARLGRWCKSKGAKAVYYVIVPSDVNGITTKGVDDYFATGGTLESLKTLATTSEPDTETADDTFTDSRLAETVADEVMADRFVWCKALGWLGWTGQQWALVTEEHVGEAVRRVVLQRFTEACERGTKASLHGWQAVLSAGRQCAILKLVKGIVERNADDFDSDPDLLNTPTGVVNLRTGEVLEYDADSVEAFWQRFIDGHARANRQKPGGIAQKETVIRVHLLPRLGSKTLDAITTEDVQRLKHDLRDKAPKTVNNVLTVLNTMLKRAVEWDELDSMPCAIKLLKVAEGSIDFYDFGEYEQMVEAAEKIGPNAHLAVLLGGDAGLRAGEMRALDWCDVDLKKRQLRVERNEWRGHVTSTKGNRVRYVPMTVRLAGALQRYRHLRSPRVLSHDDGRPLTQQVMTDLLAKVGRRANVRSNGPHIRRHT